MAQLLLLSSLQPGRIYALLDVSPCLREKEPIEQMLMHRLLQIIVDGADSLRLKSALDLGKKGSYPSPTATAELKPCSQDAMLTEHSQPV